MKDLLKLLLVSVVVSCAINSYLQFTGSVPKMAKYKMGTNVAVFTPGPEDANRSDSAIGEIDVMSNKKKDLEHYATTIVDDKSNSRGELPTMVP